MRKCKHIKTDRDIFFYLANKSNVRICYICGDNITNQKTTNYKGYIAHKSCLITDNSISLNPNGG